MATEEHKYLAGIVKTTHATLREEARNYGPEIAWKRHVSRKDVLQKYAVSMERLATTYWRGNNLNAENATLCRVEWIKSQCEEYFLRGGIRKYDEREENIKTRMDEDSAGTECSVNSNTESEATSIPFGPIHQGSAQKIRLLDVGSCYSPFGAMSMFNVTAIDLNGIPEKVARCDFLNVHVGAEKILSEDKQEILQLPTSSFDVVVFSLFLEYLPCPKQRYACCRKAYDLLQPRGVLLIVTPDSKHVNANAKLVKSWRHVLSTVGFMRIKYEKLRHVHCMIFRKNVFKQVAVRWASLQTLPEDDPLYQDRTAIYIPQDFRNASIEIDREKEEYDTNEMTSMFSELPFDDT